MKIIDSHTHVFPKKIRENKEFFFQGEPEFALLYGSPESRMVGTSQLIQMMDEQGVSQSVIFGFPWKNPDTARYHNDYIIESVQQYPERLKGLACFDLLWKDAAKETRRSMEAGLSGAGELAFYLSGIDEVALNALAPVMEVLREYGNAPCLVHTNEPIGHEYPGKTPVSLKQIYTMAKRFCDNRIILAHWGGGIFLYHAMKRQTKEVLKNIWYDTAASVFLYEPAIYDIAAASGVIDKVLFGSDYPLVPPERYYRDIQASGLSAQQKEQILGKNAARLYE